MDKIGCICVIPKQLINYIKGVGGKTKLKVDNMGKATGKGSKCLHVLFGTHVYTR